MYGPIIPLMCHFVCVCVCDRETDRDREKLETGKKGRRLCNDENEGSLHESTGKCASQLDLIVPIVPKQDIYNGASSLLKVLSLFTLKFTHFSFLLYGAQLWQQRVLLFVPLNPNQGQLTRFHLLLCGFCTSVCCLLRAKSFQDETDINLELHIK